MASFHTTEDKTRYARMYRILVDVTGNILREELLKHIQPTDIKMKIMQSIIHSVRSKYKPFKHVIDTADNDGYAKFDISILYVLLRNLCLELEQPTGGWDNRNKSTTSGEDRPISPISGKPFPYHKESTLGDDIERIHLTRNDLDHLGAASLTDSEYSFYFDQMENVCNRMDVRHFTNGKRNYWNALEVIENCPMDDKSIQVYIEHIGLAKAVEENIAQKEKEKNALDILLERSEYVIADQRSRGSKFVETNLYMKCKEALTESRTLFISGNPGEGKTRCAIELLCSVANKSERLFLNYPDQLNSIDIEAIRGIVIDNVYGDVAYEEHHWKSWKRQLQYILPMSKKRKENPLYVFITSRTYIAKSCADALEMKTVKLITNDLDQDSKLRMLEAYTSSVDTDLIVSKFSSDIGFPQVCYLFSVVKEFQDMGEKYFQMPDRYLFTLLDEFKKGQPIDLFALMMIVYLKGSVKIHTLDNGKIAEFSNSFGRDFDRLDIHSSLDKLTGSFLSFDDKYDVYSLSHDSLFDVILRFSAKTYPASLIETAEVQILINHVCVDGQSLAYDHMYVDIKESLAEELSHRYLQEFLKKTCNNKTLIQSNALFCKIVLIHFLKNLNLLDKLESFLKVTDSHESLLVEYSTYGKSELSEILLHSMERFRGKVWAKEQVCTAMTISRQFGHDSTTKVLEKAMETYSSLEERYGTNLENNKDDGCESGIDSGSESDVANDERFEDNYSEALKYHLKERKFEEIDDMIKSRKVSCVDIENEALHMIKSGEDVDTVVPEYLNNSDKCLYHSLIHSNAAAFSTLLEARSTHFDKILLTDSMIRNLEEMINSIDNDKLHLVYVFGLMIGIWKNVYRRTCLIVTKRMNSVHALKKILYFNQINKNLSNKESINPTTIHIWSISCTHEYDRESATKLLEIFESENNSYTDLLEDPSFTLYRNIFFKYLVKAIIDHSGGRFLGLAYLLALHTRTCHIQFDSHLFFSLQALKRCNINTNKTIRIVLESQNETHLLYFSLFIPEEVVIYLQNLHTLSYFDEILTLIAYFGVVELALVSYTSKQHEKIPGKDKLRVCQSEFARKLELKQKEDISKFTNMLLGCFMDREYSIKRIIRWHCFDDHNILEWKRITNIHQYDECGELEMIDIYDFPPIRGYKKNLSDAILAIFSSQDQVLRLRELLLYIDKYARSLSLSLSPSLKTLSNVLKTDDLKFPEFVLSCWEIFYLSIMFLHSCDLDITRMSLPGMMFLINVIKHLMEAFQLISRTKCSHVVFPSLSTED